MAFNKFFLVILLIASGCSSEKSHELANLGEVKKSIQHYYESNNYERDCKEIIDSAIEYINGLSLPEKATVIFDIDETSLSNYSHIKEIDFGYYYTIWLEWLKKADAVSIPQTKRFYDFLISQRIKIVFISGRNYDSYNATLENLIGQGFTKFDTVIVRNEGEKNLSASIFKSSKRKELTGKGFNIIANIGDQKSDFSGGYSGLQIKLPNYLYIIE
jgi:acid phosphatase